MTFIRPAVCLLSLPLLSACYRYVPSTRDALAPGADVRLGLTPAGATQLAPILGNQTTSVEGRVLHTTETGYMLSVSATLKSLGENGGASLSRTVWAGDSLTIPVAAVGGVERRRLDSRRTTLVAVLGAAAATATVRIIVNAVGSKSGGADNSGGVITP
jgi:hypothetical protein